MILESGVIVALGLLFTFLKCKWSTRMKMLSYPLAMDIGIFIVLTAIHWGSFYGVMIATTGAMICSAMLSLGRWMFGYIDQDFYRAGKLFNVERKLR